MPTPAAAETKRPRGSSQSKSFSRYEPGNPSATALRSRANTLSDELTGPQLLSSFDNEPPTDPLQKPLEPSEPAVAQDVAQSPSIDQLPPGFDLLPVELASLTDRFIASLTTAKIYSTPPQIEKLSDLFQDFYIQAETHIYTHIQELASRQYREVSPARSISSRTSNRAKSIKDASEKVEKAIPGQQMLTPDEIHERKKARKLLEFKRTALEEAVERRVCEKIYSRIWRHRSTIDEMRDEKLRSRTAGLAVVGVGLEDLGIELQLTPEAEEWIHKAQCNLLDMDTAHYPLGKLQSLAAAHQNVVELLTASHQGSSSADEILPALIYILISAKVPSSLISNLNFIQRFRTASKINGEAAYCLTNLEAAITFVETVDLASLRDEKEPQTVLGSKQEASKAQPSGTGAAAVSSSVPQQGAQSTRSKPSSSLTIDIKPSPPIIPAAPSPSNRLSTLFQPPAALGAAGDAVRNTADEGIRSIGTALDKSFSFMFGKLKEQNSDTSVTVVVPKTLDEARRMVSPKAMTEEDGTMSDSASLTAQEEKPPKEDRVLDMITGARAARDRSADSAASGGSSNRKRADSRTNAPPIGLGVSPGGAVESMRNLGNSLNRFASMNMMKGFGRTASSPTVATHSAIAQANMETQPDQGDFDKEELDPPIQRFLEITDAHDLKIGDIAVLLKDYQRLSAIVRAKGIV